MSETDREWRALKVVVEESKAKLGDEWSAEVTANFRIRAAVRVLDGFVVSSYIDEFNREQREYLLKERAALQIIARRSL